MRTYKKIVMLIICIMLCFQTIITASAQERIIFSDDFDSYMNINSMSKTWNLKECCEYSSVRGGALHVKNRDGGAPVICMPDGTIAKKLTSGCVTIKFDVLMENLGGVTWGIMSLVPEGTYDYGKYRVIDFYRTKDKAIIRDPYKNENYVQIGISKWYGIEGKFYPGENCRFCITVYDDKGNELGGYSREGEECEGFLTDFSNINFTSWSDRDYAIDNLEIRYSE